MVKINNYSTALNRKTENIEKTDAILRASSIFTVDWSASYLGNVDSIVLGGDFMYCEPSWRAGFYKYNGKDKARFERFMLTLDKLATFYAEKGRPAVIMCGKESQKYLTTTYACEGAIMIGNKKHSPALAYCYNYVPKKAPLTNYDFIQDMLDRGYRIPFDPTAGYGELYDEFPDLIATDIRQECVNEIIKHRKELGLL